MRFVSLYTVAIIFLAGSFLAKGDPSTNLKLTEQTRHSAVVERVSSIILSNGDSRMRTNRYEVLGAGLYRDNAGKVIPGDAALELRGGGAVGEKTAHKVKFSANINNWKGAIDFETPDQQRFLSRPLGISYFDEASGQSVLVAELKDSVGDLFPPSKIVYSDAFTDIKADLEYNNLLSGLQQNLIFRTKVPAPAEFGLQNETSYIELLTEFFESPLPKKRTRNRGDVFDDQHLDFGSSQIGVGKSFMIGDEKRSIPVEKQWKEIEGRVFLIERVRYHRIAPFLNTLPVAKDAKAKASDGLRAASRVRSIPSKALSRASESRLHVAVAAPDATGFVLDYSLVGSSGLTNFTFRSDTTYFVTNLVNLYGTTVFEGGSVIKYYPSSGLGIYGSIVCETDAYRPVIFTSFDDDRVGVSVGDGSGTPSQVASTAMAVFNTGPVSGAEYRNELRHLRFSHLSQAIEFDGAADLVADCQFTDVITGMSVVGFGGFLRLQNNLYFDCDTVFAGEGVSVSGEHLTVNLVGTFMTDFGALEVRLTNSLFVAVTNLGVTNINSTNDNFIWFTNDPGVFLTVGAAGHYLPTNSVYRNVGTTNIHTDLLKLLSERTTYPPTVTVNVAFTNTSLTLSPAAPRDNDGTPDLGYHYVPLDHVLGGVSFQNASLLLTNGVAVGFFYTNNASCALLGGGSFISTGSPTKPNHVVWINNVQEQIDGTWAALPWWPTTMFSDLSADQVTDCRFTRFAMMAQPYPYYDYLDIGFAGSLAFRDCEFYGGTINWVSTGPLNLELRNNAFQRVSLTIRSFVEQLTFAGYNNLFHKGQFSFVDDQYTGTYSAALKDNFFFETTVSQTGTIANSHNAYTTNVARLVPHSLTDVTNITSLSFQRGELGHFYQPTNSSLVNAGSRSAADAGLYHHTVSTNQVKEGSSTCDIGYHYVAIGSVTGQPLDIDSDGIPDHKEDGNGNGRSDLAETDWNNNALDAGEVLLGWIAAGYNHNLSLKTDGTVLGWGHNLNGQVGDGSKLNRPLPVAVTNLDNVKWLSASELHSVAVKQDGTVWGWGSRANGRLGDGLTAGDVTNAVQSSISNVVRVAAGADHTIALKQDGTVWSWGVNTFGRLGDGTATQRALPVQVGAPGNYLTNIVSISAGESHNLALRADGTVWAWGHNTAGKIGDGTAVHRTNHVQVGTNGAWLSEVVAVSAGRTHSLAVKTDGTVWAWGDNANGRLGDGSTVDRYLPTLTTNLSRIVAVAAGYNHSLALREDGTVWAWGLNTFGQLGDGTLLQRTVPTPVIGLSNVVAIAVGEEHSLALLNDGEIMSWGHTQLGQLGNGTFDYWSTFQVVTNGFSRISAGYNHNLAISTNGTAIAWGYNVAGQLGDTTKTNRARPVQVVGLTNVNQIDGGDLHSLATDSNGLAWAWGDNASSKLGVNGVDRTNAVQVGYTGNFFDNVRMLSGGASHTLGLKNDGTVWAWGLNSNGRLGDGTATTRTNPVQVGTNGYYLEGIVAISAGDAHNLAVSSNGTLFGWGNNSNGRIGDNTTVHRTNHVQVGNSGFWSTNEFTISAGGSHSLAISTNGTVYAWGNNGNGRLGLNNISTGPTQPALITNANITNMVAVSAGMSHSLALRGDGTVWAWGANTFGQLGDNTTTQQPGPVQVAGLTNVVAIAAGEAHSIALQVDGTIVAWGHTQFGQVGSGNVGYTSSASSVIIEAPKISQQPQSATRNAGAYVTFAVAATGSNLQFRWKKDGIFLRDSINVSGTHTATLLISEIMQADAGEYAAIVTNPVGAVSSIVATLTVVDPPVITSQPVSATNMFGGIAAFQAGVAGTGPFTFWWTKDGILLTDTSKISGSTSATLQIARISNEDSGVYRLGVSNAAGVTVSSEALLTVVAVDADYDGRNYDQELSDGTNPNDPADVRHVTLASWTWSQQTNAMWKAEGTAVDAVSGNAATLAGNVQFGKGKLGQGFEFDGSGGTVQIDNNLGNFGVSNFVIELQVKGTNPVPEMLINKGAIASEESYWSISKAEDGCILVQLRSGTNSLVQIKGKTAIIDGSFHRVSLQRIGSEIGLYIDGSLDARIASPDLSIQNGSQLQLGVLNGDPHFSAFRGIVDQVWIGLPGDLVGDQGQDPITNSNVIPFPSWSGGGLQCTPKGRQNLTYRDVEENGTANVNFREGTIRFWFMPGWTTNQGNGVTAIDLVGVGSHETTNWWGLSLASNLSSLILTAKEGELEGVYLTHQLNFQPSKWYQVALSYGAGGEIALYINGHLATSTNQSDVIVPSQFTRSLGWGFRSISALPCAIDDLETFNYVLTAEEIAASYNSKINQPPIFEISDSVLAASSGTQFVSSFLLSISPGNNEAEQNLEFILESSEPSAFEFPPISSENGDLTFSLSSRATSQVEVAVWAIDTGGTENGGTNVSSYKMFTVLPDFPEPILAASNISASILEDGALDLHVEHLSGSYPGEVSIHLLTQATNGVATLGSEHTLSYTPLPNLHGSDSIAYFLTSQTHTSAPAIVSIEIVPVNDAPELTVLTNEIHIEQGAGLVIVSNFVISKTAGAADEGSQNLTLYVEAELPDCFVVSPQIDHNGHLSFVLNSNCFGEILANVRLQDDGGIDNDGENERSIPITFHVAPVLTLVAPVQNSLFVEHQPVAVQASLLAGRTTAAIQFFDGETLLTNLTEQPYSFVLSNLAVGNHSIMAKADVGGILVTSPAISVDVVSDADADGMPDDWEVQHGLEPSSNSDIIGDLDGDGLLNLQEFQAGTDPRLYDTDFDGRNDVEELLEGTSPSDGSSYTRVRLEYFPFRSASAVASSGLHPSTISNIDSATNWSGAAALLSSNSSLGYPTVRSNKTVVIAPITGSVSLWIRPDWSPTNIASSSSNGISLIAFGQSTNWLGLQLENNGLSLSLIHVSNDVKTVISAAPLALESNKWSSLAVTYSPTRIELFAEGIQLMSTEARPELLDPNLMETGTLWLGRSPTGVERFQGAIDELFTYNYVLAQPFIRQAHMVGLKAGYEMVWIDDQLPGGSVEHVNSGQFGWTNDLPPPFSGGYNLNIFSQTNGVFGCEGATGSLPLNSSDRLSVYLSIDPTNACESFGLRLQVDGNWNYGVYWGSNAFAWGTNAHPSRMRLGDLPNSGDWVRLEIPVSVIGVQDAHLTGVEFWIANGKAAIDRFGKVRFDSDTDGLSDDWELDVAGDLEQNADTDTLGLGIPNSWQAELGIWRGTLASPNLSRSISHTLFLTATNTVLGWGCNCSGELGDGTLTSTTVPVLVQTPNNIVSISAGGHHSLVLDGIGRAWGFGRNNAGQLGTLASQDPVSFPVQCRTNITAVSALNGFSIFLGSNTVIEAEGDIQYTE